MKTDCSLRDENAECLKVLLYFFGWGDVVLAERSFPKGQATHAPTHLVTTYLPRYLLLLFNFSFFINSLHQHRSSHIDLLLNIVLPLCLELGTRPSI
jgi:hypothetical protein